jgi:hypothetical protein
LQLTKLIAKAISQRAERPVKEVYMAVAEKLELCKGLSERLYRILHAMFVVHQR